MPRETKAQRLEREEAERAARNAELAATFPQRLMSMLERAVNVKFEITVKNSKFVVLDKEDNREMDFTLDYSEMNESALRELDWRVYCTEQEDAEVRRKQELRANALSKLTAEEREELGL